ncbi:hypothetical protein I7I48_12143 [Histoplasma ohiense]|nr:hypothetical protein I7I48_12143 [Histoplasma ohiense (nom. inval.)]
MQTLERTGDEKFTSLGAFRKLVIVRPASDNASYLSTYLPTCSIFNQLLIESGILDTHLPVHLTA